MIFYLTLLSFFSIANGLQCYNCVWLDNLEKLDPEFSPGDVNINEKCLRPDTTLLEICPVFDPGNTEPEACLNMTYFLKPKPNTRFEKDFNLYFRFCNSTSVFTKIQQFSTTRQRQPTFCARFGLAEVMEDEYNADSVMYNFERDSVIEFCSCTGDGCNAGVISEDSGGNGDGGENGGGGCLKSNYIFYLSFVAFALYKNVK